MTKEEIECVLEERGLESILEDNQTTLVEVLDILNELGYIHLDMYLTEE